MKKKFESKGWVPEFWFEELQIVEMMEIFPSKRYVKKKWIGDPIKVKIIVEEL